VHEKLDMATTISVGAGRLAPNCENTSVNTGTTNSMMMDTTTKATTITAIG